MGKITRVLSAQIILLVSCFYLQFCTASDTITPAKSIKDPEVIISKSGVFKLGFFSFANSTNRCVGICHNQIPVQTVIWVANRNKPLKDSSGTVKIFEDGNLVVLNGQEQILWSSTVTDSVANTSALLSDTGNLVLTNNNNGVSIWESFQYPANAFMPTMRIGIDGRTGKKVQLRSWKSPTDPADGEFTSSLEPLNIPEIVIRRNNQTYHRSGPWNGRAFVGIIGMNTVCLDGYYVFADDQEETYYFTYDISNKSMVLYYEFDSQGRILERIWDAGEGDWKYSIPVLENDCDVYGKCGAFGNCNSTTSSICSCLRGFEPKNIEEWNRGNWTNGCVRTTPLQCQKAKNGASGVGKKDGFLKLERIGDLIDIQKFPIRVVDLYICLASSELGKKQKTEQNNLIFNKGKATAKISSDNVVGEDLIEVKLQQPPLINFEELAAATNNFHLTEKLGQGGFGPVYRGTLQDGKEIGVKRLSRSSGQGLEEFMNEVMVISKLQHRNLVRLLRCCIEGEEKMLVYEYMPNKSLDSFLFDPVKKELLNWKKRFNVIEGISRGLLYLHIDSRLRIIHRDLKASNVLPDEELNPKISDFGMARIFGGNENQANTRRVVGTYGYMSPEYAMQGQFSEKPDVFSFGVLLLEVVSGRKNTSFYNDPHSFSLLGYAWKLWKENRILDFIDKGISDSNYHKEILRCINIGLLCVQEFAKDRPKISSVVLMINSEIVDLPTPKQPAFTEREITQEDVENRSSVNDVTLTDFDGR
ncbi:hypothetical protein PTKIN_Ptkin14bG0223100 [Pterospermum kingtungense]